MKSKIIWINHKIKTKTPTGNEMLREVQIPLRWPKDTITATEIRQYVNNQKAAVTFQRETGESGRVKGKPIELDHNMVFYVR